MSTGWRVGVALAALAALFGGMEHYRTSAQAAERQAAAPVEDPFVNLEPVANPCPYGYMPKPGAPGDCTIAPGFVVAQSAQPDGTQQAIEEQTRVLRQIQQEQVNADLRQR